MNVFSVALRAREQVTSHRERGWDPEDHALGFAITVALECSEQDLWPLCLCGWRGEGPSDHHRDWTALDSTSKRIQLAKTAHKLYMDEIEPPPPSFRQIMGKQSLSDALPDLFTLEFQLCDDDGIVRCGSLHHGMDYFCTGHAHTGGEHIRCTNPVHRRL